METPEFALNKLFAGAGLSPAADPESEPRTGTTFEEWTQIGQQAVIEGDLQTAAQAFERALALASDHNRSDALIELASVISITGEAQRALQLYQEALIAQPKRADIHTSVAQLLLTHGQFESAIEQLEAAAKLSPKEGMIPFFISEAYRSRGYPKKAYNFILVAINLTPDQAHYQLQAAELALQIKETEEAVLHFRKAIDLSPGDDYVYLRASIGFWVGGYRTESIKALRIAIDLDPDQNVYHGLLQTLLSESGLLDEARLEQEKAAPMDAYDLASLRTMLTELGIDSGNPSSNFGNRA